MSEHPDPYSTNPMPAQQEAWQEVPAQQEAPQYQEPIWTTPVAPPERQWNAFWPLALLMLSFLILLITQVIGNSKTKSALETGRTDREKMVVEADKVSTSLQSLATDLLELAKTNDQARAVVEKYQIKQTAPTK